jgi:hypothetical protein
MWYSDVALILCKTYGPGSSIIGVCVGIIRTVQKARTDDKLFISFLVPIFLAGVLVMIF